MPYYAEKLSSERLKRCYDLAPPGVRAYLDAEIDYVRERAASAGWLLELGCGYGRVLRAIARPRTKIVGIDTSVESLSMAQHLLSDLEDVSLCLMDAVRLGFSSGVFDLVCCVQNGISAFRVDQRRLLEEAVRVAKPGGVVLFSSYAAEFWEDRLNWFRIQSAHGLVGEIDETATADGTIVTRDGFIATTVSPQQFQELARGLGSTVEIRTVAGSSVFCEITV